MHSYIQTILQKQDTTLNKKRSHLTRNYSLKCHILLLKSLMADVNGRIFQPIFPCVDAGQLVLVAEDSASTLPFSVLGDPVDGGQVGACQ
jgi:hypothetical protein